MTDERAQLIQDYLDGHMSRGGLLSDEIRAQAVAYADRIVSNREYEAGLKAHADKQRTQLRAASNDAALRERSNRKALESTYINRFVGENTQVTPELRQLAALYAQRVLAAHDPAVERRAVEQAAQRLEAGKQARTQRCAALRKMLADEIGSNAYRDLRGKIQLLRQALEDLEGELMREALRPAQQDAPQESGEDSAVSARGRRHRHTARNNT